MTPACVSRQSLSSHRKSTLEKYLSSKKILFCSKSTQGRQTSRAIRAQSWKFSPTAGAPAAQDVKLASLIECCQTHLHIGVVIGCLISQVNVDFKVRKSCSYALLKNHIQEIFTFPLQAYWYFKPVLMAPVSESEPPVGNLVGFALCKSQARLEIATVAEVEWDWIGTNWLWRPYQVITGFGDLTRYLLALVEGDLTSWSASLLVLGSARKPPTASQARWASAQLPAWAIFPSLYFTGFFEQLKPGMRWKGNSCGCRRRQPSRQDILWLAPCLLSGGRLWVRLSEVEDPLWFSLLVVVLLVLLGERWAQLRNND